jgi:hypothetical protein
MILRVRAKLPGDEPAPRPAGWTLAAAGVVVMTLWATVTMLIDAREPPGHIRHWLAEHGGTYAYPTQDAIVGISVLYTEAIAVLAIVRARGRFALWARCALIGALITPCFIIALAGSAVLGAIGLWQLFAGGWLLGVAALLVIVGLVRYIRMRRTSGY